MACACWPRVWNAIVSPGSFALNIAMLGNNWRQQAELCRRKMGDGAHRENILQALVAGVPPDQPAEGTVQVSACAVADQRDVLRVTSLADIQAHDWLLDPERKRMFMAMKREVLRIGGYRQEYFVSPTPELTAMADAVIDLDTLRANASCAIAQT